MKHTYHIHGMTCNGCRSHVEKTLSEVDGVSSASVDLEKAQTTIEMHSHIALETFQKALLDDGGAYSIHNLGDHHHQEIKKEKSIDIKFELGFRTSDKKLLLSDVVDNDSWRIWPGGYPNKQLDKQSFREGENLSNVSNKYQLVTELTNQFKGV